MVLPTKSKGSVGLRGCFERQRVKDIPAAFAELYPTTFLQFVGRLFTSLFRFGVLAAVATHFMYFLVCDHPIKGSGILEAYLPQGVAALSFLRFSPNDTFLGLPLPAIQLGAAICAAHLLTFIVCHTFYLVCDKTRWLSQYRLSRAPATIPTPALISKAAKSQSIALVALHPAMAALGATYLMSADRGGMCAAINFWDNAVLFGCAILFNETGFYAVHRLLHEVPFLYRTIHKKHHEFIGSVSIAAEYSHPVEDILAAVIPTLGIFLVPGLPPMHPLFAFVWIAARSAETYEAHSGYCFHNTLLQKLGLLHSSHMAFHDFHHTVNKGNYGTSLLWDYLLGTDTFYTAKLATAGV